MEILAIPRTPYGVQPSSGLRGRRALSIPALRFAYTGLFTFKAFRPCAHAISSNNCALKSLMCLAVLLSSTTAMSQNLDSIPKAKRDSILIAVAKEVVLTYGPGYYREYKEPVIKRFVYPKDDVDGGKNTGRICYSVVFLYDKTKEQLELDAAAGVGIWADTGKPFSVRFGNGWGKFIPETGLRSGEVIVPVPYQQREVFPPAFPEEKNK
jgi:hypothetical protein